MHLKHSHVIFWETFGNIPPGEWCLSYDTTRKIHLQTFHRIRTNFLFFFAKALRVVTAVSTQNRRARSTMVKGLFNSLTPKFKKKRELVYNHLSSE